MNNELVDIYVKDRPEPISYSMDSHLKIYLDRIKGTLVQQDRDFVMVVDGDEGSGKSTLAFQVGKYIDNDLDLSRIVFTADEFRRAILAAPKGSCVIFDEAFVGLSSRTALSKVNKMLVSLMMQMRQKNLFVILVMPSFFLLDKYAALFRSKVLLHVFENKTRRGYFKLFNKRDKKFLFLTGAKYYSYGKAKTIFKGRFYGKFALGAELEQQYRDKKAQALIDTESERESEDGDKYSAARNNLIRLIHKEFNLDVNNIEALLSKYKVNLKQRMIYRIVAKAVENMA